MKAKSLIALSSSIIGAGLVTYSGLEVRDTQRAREAMSQTFPEAQSIIYQREFIDLVRNGQAGVLREKNYIPALGELVPREKENLEAMTQRVEENIRVAESRPEIREQIGEYNEISSECEQKDMYSILRGGLGLVMFACGTFYAACLIPHGCRFNVSISNNR